MKNNLKILLVSIIGVLFLIVLSFSIGWWAKGKQVGNVQIIPDTITIHHWDTSYIPSPPDTITKTEYKNVPVPFYIKGDTDTIIDSVLIPLLFEHHLTHVENVCDIYHSGFQSSIDSVVAYHQLITQILKQPPEVKYRRPKFDLEVGMGMTYIPTGSKVGGYAIAKASYNTNHCSFGLFAAYHTEKIPVFGGQITYQIINPR